VTYLGSRIRRKGSADPGAGARRAYGAVLVGMAMGALDIATVGSAAPRIAADLNDVAIVGGLITTFTIGTTASIPVVGIMADRFGAKFVFQCSCLVFMAGALLAATATTAHVLLMARVAQGVGAGGLITLPHIMLGMLVTPRSRGRYINQLGVMYLVVNVGGPLIAGLVTDHLSWRTVFLLPLPIGMLSIVMTARFVPAVTTRAPRPKGRYRGVVGNWTVLSASLLGCATGVIMYITIVYVPILFQSRFDRSATSAGAFLSAFMLALIGSMIVANRSIARWQRYKAFTVGGGALLVLGTSVLAAAPHVDEHLAAAAVILLGLGVGCLVQLPMLVIHNSVSTAALGAATAGAQFFRESAGLVGNLVAGSLFTRMVTQATPSAIGQRMSPRALVELPPDLVAAAVSRVYGMVGVTAAVAALALGLTLKNEPLRDTTESISS
jgi:MFS family permease